MVHIKKKKRPICVYMRERENEYYSQMGRDLAKYYTTRNLYKPVLGNT